LVVLSVVEAPVSSATSVRVTSATFGAVLVDVDNSAVDAYLAGANKSTVFLDDSAVDHPFVLESHEAVAFASVCLTVKHNLHRKGKG
jgi:hypothetical protein